MNPETINYNSAEKRNIMATFAARGGHLAGNYGVTLYNCPSKLRATAFVKPVNFIISNSAFLNGRPSASAFQAQDIKGQNASKFLQELTPQGSQHYSRPRIFSGTANLPLAQEIACYMGLELGKIKSNALQMVKSMFNFKKVFEDVMYFSCSQHVHLQMRI